MNGSTNEPSVGKWIHASLEIAFPPVCVFCRRICAPDKAFPGICKACLANLPLRFGHDTRMDWAKLTGEPVPAGSCLYCAAQYEGVIREALLRMKFADAPDIAESLASLMAQVIRRRSLRFHAVTAVPLHRVRLRERGYNQAALLAEDIAGRFEKPDWSGCLVRVRETQRQSSAGSRTTRMMNMAGAFEMADRPAGGVETATVLLIDDVLTTGATLTAAAKPFWDAGFLVAGMVVASNCHPATETVIRRQKLSSED